MEIGDNRAAVLRGFADRIIDIEDEIERLKDDQKVAKTRIKAFNIPPAETISLFAATEESLQKRAEKQRLASAVCGKPALGGFIEATLADIDLQEDSAKEIIDLVEKVLDKRQEVKELGDRRKEVYREAVAEGFSSKILKNAIDIIRNQGNVDTIVSNSSAVKAYVTAYRSATTASP